jgi:hypothetical protein
MFTNTPFESAAKTMFAGAPKFNPAAMQDAVKPVMDSFKAWGDLAQKQAQVAQAAVAESIEAFKSIKEPQAAFEAMKTSAEIGVTIATKNLKDVTALSVAQFKTGVDTLEKASPAPETFASVGKGLKEAATTLENALESAMKQGAAAVASVAPAATAKKSRAA